MLLLAFMVEIFTDAELSLDRILSFPECTELFKKFMTQEKSLGKLFDINHAVFLKKSLQMVFYRYRKSHGQNLGIVLISFQKNTPNLYKVQIVYVFKVFNSTKS